ncbi:MAG: N-6 DNA methylase [Sulfurimonas sp.]|nr:N-6 DNA methylase [Sulfurimonas sp.]
MMIMNSNQNDLIVKLQFTPKENTTKIYQKKYSNHDDYIIEIDLDKNSINFGNSIFFNDSKNSVQKITKAEDLVVLECVDRLLIKGYNPKNIILEKIYPSGHGTSGRLDILVTRDNNSAYLMIECKTWDKEFDKAFVKLNKDGGQLFTYFQQDKNAEVLVLYASELINDEIKYTNQIIKIEEEYKTTSNVKDFFDRWNKVPKNNGIFDSWTTPYNYKSKALTPKELVEITAEDSSKIFNRFMEILRHNVVSDKPNAFSKIFTLFLCKIIDEKDTKQNKELRFQWLEGIDTHISFQKRLTDLYKKGMKQFLDKEVTDFSDDEFEEKFGDLDNSLKEKLLEKFTEIRLQKNNEFAIKDVFDQETFEENAIVVKEVVELLQNYQIRYTKKQQFLSDFFELLLTTGLKQEVGQFFTPVPVARFIIRSIPFDKIIKEKLMIGEERELLPNVIDYAVGSGHFITEAMDEIQKNINTIDTKDFINDVVNEVEAWKIKHFSWAYNYVYGIEKDYRLVKTAKVGCYLHGDGLAKVIHGDGLSNFTNTKEFKGKLIKKDKNYPQDNKQFDMVISNPPYSVSAFKNISKKFNKDDFELYEKLTDQSSEIEALFIERTKQLLKDGGIAGIILPSSILSNGGIYTKTREILFKYFDIISITELSSNTFMATKTSTVVLFLRRKNNMEYKNIQSSVGKLFDIKKDITINKIENPLLRYIEYVWEDINIDDYFSLLDNNPNKKIKTHEIYKEYDKKIGTLEKIIELEKEKLFYFIMVYSQRIVVVKTKKGIAKTKEEKKRETQEEKQFLGYEFSSRRGSEGIHPIQRGKTIDECTSLYDETSHTNDLKANSYIYSAFNGELKEIDESLKDNISYVDLVDMMTFDRVDFDKNISLSVKKKIKYENIWGINNLIELNVIADVEKGTSITQEKTIEGKIPVIAGGQTPAYYHNESNRVENIITVSASGAYSGYVNYFDTPIFASDCNTVKSKNENRISTKLIFIFLKYLQPYIYSLQRGQAQPHVYKNDLEKIKIPLLSKDVREKIVTKIEVLENKNLKQLQEIKHLKKSIEKMYIDIISTTSTTVRLSDTDIFSILIGKRVLKRDVQIKGEIPIYSANVFKSFGYIDKHLLSKYDTPSILWGIDGDWMVNCLSKESPFYPTDHCGVLRVKNNEIDERLLAYIVEQEGKNLEFSRTKRASIDRIKGIKIPLPSIEKQKEVAPKIKLIEKKIRKLEQELANISKQKEDIFGKYLK